jgi:nucleotide-binding universal stress UspA family protein
MYKNILVPMDGSDLAECVLPHVQTMAEARGVQSVTFVRVTEPLSITPVRGETGWLTEEQMKDVDDKSKVVAESYLDKLVGGLNYGKVKVQKEVLVGRAAEQLAEYAKKNDFDLIIVATHGRSGVSRWVWGSVADRLIRSAHVPVLMVRSPGCPPHA